MSQMEEHSQPRRVEAEFETGVDWNRGNCSVASSVATSEAAPRQGNARKMFLAHSPSYEIEDDALFEENLNRMELPSTASPTIAANSISVGGASHLCSSGTDMAESLFEAALSRMDLPKSMATSRVEEKMINADSTVLKQSKHQNHTSDKKRQGTNEGSSPCSSPFKSRRRLCFGEQQHQQPQNQYKTTLPPPSDEQKAVIDAVLSGYCVTLPSVAGSGKTTCMLQVANALPLDRTVTIITYNRSLCDECKGRISKCGLVGRVWAYTIHGLVTKVSGRPCNDDAKLGQIVKGWDRGCMDVCALAMDVVLIDEAQDLRPIFYQAICHVLRASAVSRGRGHLKTMCCPQNKSFQICLVGDPKQMLYDFPTFGSDRASVKYMNYPEDYWGAYTVGRTWVRKELTVSYRLTPNIASFVNAIWGTSIKGGNDNDPNLPVEYLCKYPYPPSNSNEDPEKLSTKFLDSLIRTNGPENVLFLAQSVKNEKCPIRVHVNALCEMRNSKGEQIHNFHIKESLRGYEDNTDVKNKVRVWTFCGSKGCEADVVVLFGLDMLNFGRVHALNQVGVALSRARKRLIVIHGKTFTGKGKNAELIANPYYPLLGDASDGMASHSIIYGGDKTLQVSVPPYTQGNKEALHQRSLLTQSVLEQFSDSGVLSTCSTGLPLATNDDEGEKKQIVYVASEFAYFAASEEARFLDYAVWIKEAPVGKRIDYKIGVQFLQTTEDVSALYGEALTYMLQWNRDGFCPNIETVVNDGILELCPYVYYSDSDLKKNLTKKKCENLSVRGEELLQTEFDRHNGKKLKGKDLIQFVNTRINIRKKRIDGDRVIYFRVKAIEERGDKDENMSQFVNEIRSVYSSHTKTPPQWVYLANAAMAFSNYVEKFHQIGTSPTSYERWVESKALYEGLSRLSGLMKAVPSCSSSLSSDHDVAIENDSFERELNFEFSPENHISSATNSQVVVGIQGVCDWVGRGLRSPQGESVDLLEIKFINELCNMHRLQVLSYCALLALEEGKDCSGMLYNARTGELEICHIKESAAEAFLLDIAQFKFNGERRIAQTVKNSKDKSSIFYPRDDDEFSLEGSGCFGSSCFAGTQDDPILL